MAGGTDSVVDGIIIDDDIYPENDAAPPLTAAQQRRSLRPGTPSMTDRDASSGIPKIDEWMHFFSYVIIRTATDYYIDVAFRGVDENMLSERDYEHIMLSDEERDRIARPFAELAVKNRYTRKHGRSIIAAGDSIDAVLQMGMWFSRVNRIAKRYKAFAPQQHSPRKSRQPAERAERQEESVSTEQGQTPSANGYHRPDIPDGFPVLPNFS